MLLFGLLLSCPLVPGLLLSCFFWSLRVMFTLVLSRRACLLLSVFSCPTSAPSFLVLSCYLVGSCRVSSCLASSRLLWSCPLWTCPGGLWEPLGSLLGWVSCFRGEKSLVNYVVWARRPLKNLGLAARFA